MSNTAKRLYRSRENRWLAGICGGIGAYFDLDPTVIRVLFVLFALAVGGGILLYVLLWIIIPIEPETLAADTHGQESNEGVAAEPRS